MFADNVKGLNSSQKIDDPKPIVFKWGIIVSGNYCTVLWVSPYPGNSFSCSKPVVLYDVTSNESPSSAKTSWNTTNNCNQLSTCASLFLKRYTWLVTLYLNSSPIDEFLVMCLGLGGLVCDAKQVCRYPWQPWQQQPPGTITQMNQWNT